jgi:hypothetical protein
MDMHDAVRAAVHRGDVARFEQAHPDFKLKPFEFKPEKEKPKLQYTLLPKESWISAGASVARAVTNPHLVTNITVRVLVGGAHEQKEECAVIGWSPTDMVVAGIRGGRLHLWILPARKVPRDTITAVRQVAASNRGSGYAEDQKYEATSFAAGTFTRLAPVGATPVWHIMDGPLSGRSCNQVRGLPFPSLPFPSASLAHQAQ